QTGSYDEVVYCTGCKTQLSRETKTIDALNHNWGEWTVTKAATCTAKGEETRTCANDASHVERRDIDIDPNAHTPGQPVRENEVPAECEKAGSYDEVVYCTGCKAVISRETKTIDALEHKWSDWAPVEGKDGYESRTCSECKKVEEREIKAEEPSGGDEPSSLAYNASKGGSYSVPANLKGVTKVTVDGKEVDPKDYTVDEDGNIVLSEDFMKALGAGDHTLQATNNAGGAATANFSVTIAPATGDSTRVAAFGIAAILSLIGAALVVVSNKRKRA
ncbi:MAG: LPXTG cell wall anchor domain-containing protein, partial [Oscillospiraceae bacterium]|nr:LPXTG cell wall anchor domain-containing protein [Oscillospiraceae bacterium]